MIAYEVRRYRVNEYTDSIHFYNNGKEFMHCTADYESNMPRNQTFEDGFPKGSVYDELMEIRAEQKEDTDLLTSASTAEAAGQAKAQLPNDSKYGVMKKSNKVGWKSTIAGWKKTKT